MAYFTKRPPRWFSVLLTFELLVVLINAALILSLGAVIWITGTGSLPSGIVEFTIIMASITAPQWIAFSIWSRKAALRDISDPFSLKGRQVIVSQIVGREKSTSKILN